MKKFLELIEQNEALKQRVTELDANTETKVLDYIALAAEYGVQLTEADFQQTDAGELSDDELDAVAGGKTCVCVAGGGGTGEDATGTKTCACVMIGNGDMQSGERRCVCALGGGGQDHAKDTDHNGF